MRLGVTSKSYMGYWEATHCFQNNINMYRVNEADLSSWNIKAILFFDTLSPFWSHCIPVFINIIIYTERSVVGMKAVKRNNVLT